MGGIIGFFSQIGTLWTLFGYISKVNTILKTYPGMENEIRFRAWLLDNLAILSGVATKTANVVDDMIVDYTERIIENDSAWKILFKIVSVANFLRQDGQNKQNITTDSPVFDENDAEEDCFDSLYDINTSLKNDESGNKEQTVENPLLVISAVGLIIQILQYLQSRK
ncbi:MAG: hypothetical protein FWC50_04930 [Planctomycetaceae bacterium]|nr:hypothetical protein [Planctomycetaceae bacterium]